MLHPSIVEDQSQHGEDLEYPGVAQNYIRLWGKFYADSRARKHRAFAAEYTWFLHRLGRVPQQEQTAQDAIQLGNPFRVIP